MEVSLLVGDTSAAPLRWDLGTLLLQSAGQLSPVKQLTAASMPVTYNKPVINHIFVRTCLCCVHVLSLQHTHFY
jgi:hypothetical protein